MIFEPDQPRTIRMDNGSGFNSIALDCFSYENGVTFDFSRPGKPTDNAFVETFNGRLWDECLNMHWFLSLRDALAQIEVWPRDYVAGQFRGTPAPSRSAAVALSR